MGSGNLNENKDGNKGFMKPSFFAVPERFSHFFNFKFKFDQVLASVKN